MLNCYLVFMEKKIVEAQGGSTVGLQFPLVACETLNKSCLKVNHNQRQVMFIIVLIVELKRGVYSCKLIISFVLKR